MYAGFAGAKTGHGCPALGSCLVLVGWPDLFDFAPFCWGYLRTVFTIGGEDIMETGEVNSGLGDQCEQHGDDKSAGQTICTTEGRPAGVRHKDVPNEIQRVTST